MLNLGESNYTIKEICMDQTVIFNVHGILSNPNRHELFKGKYFYVTPGIKHPSMNDVQKIIESAGGTVEHQRKSLRRIQELGPNNTYIIITCRNDFHLVSYLLPSFNGKYLIL